MSSQLYGACVTALLEELRSADTPVRVSAKHEENPRSSDSPDVSGSTAVLTASGDGDKSVRAPSLYVDLEDEVVRGSIVLHEGKMMWPPPPRPTPPAPPEPGVPTKSSHAVAAAKAASNGHDDGNGVSPWLLGIIGLIMLGLAFILPPKAATEGGDFLGHLTVFILAIFIGFQVVWNVKPALHTPLMSVTNAISGIILVGGMLQLTSSSLDLTVILGAIAVALSAINIAGGFLVTNRMLGMFRK